MNFFFLKGIEIIYIYICENRFEIIYLLVKIVYFNSDIFINSNMIW